MVGTVPDQQWEDFPKCTAAGVIHLYIQKAFIKKIIIPGMNFKP